MTINYFDSASTTKVDSRVLEEMLPYFTEIYGNASSNHDFGKIAKEAINKARNQLATLINTNASEIIFTSWTTEPITVANYFFYN
jgi:cysteine desulfurase